MNFNGAKIACFGDSLTQHGIWIEEAAEQLCRKLPGAKTELYNCGIGGASLSSAMWKIGEDVMSCFPDYVLISFGANDIGCGLYDRGGTAEEKQERITKYEESLKTCTDYFAKRGVGVIISAPPPFDFFDGGVHIEEKLDALKKIGLAARKIAKIADAAFIDLYDDMSCAVRAFAKTGTHLFRDDGIHPNELGYRILGRIVLSRLGFPVSVPMNAAEAAEEFGEFSEANKRRFELEQKLRLAFWIKYTVDMLSQTYKLTGFDREHTAERLLARLEDGETSQWIKDGIKTYLAFGGELGGLRERLAAETRKMYSE